MAEIISWLCRLNVAQTLASHGSDISDIIAHHHRLGFVDAATFPTY